MAKLNLSAISAATLVGWSCLWPLGWACSWPTWWAGSALAYFAATSLIFGWSFFHDGRTDPDA